MPVPVSNLTGATQIAIGDAFTCALIFGGTVKCWGDNEFGQLGDGTFTVRAVPTSVVGLSNVSSLSAGLRHMCAVLTSGQVMLGMERIRSTRGRHDDQSADTCVACGSGGWHSRCHLNRWRVSAYVCGDVRPGCRCWNDDSTQMLGGKCKR